MKVDTLNFDSLLEQLKEQLKMFAKTTFEPQKDITIYELAQIVKLIMSCISTGRNPRSEIKLYSIDNYHTFIKEYDDVVRHFDVQVFGNSKKESET